jgi:uncharacterized protein (DUF1330 family)
MFSRVAVPVIVLVDGWFEVVERGDLTDQSVVVLDYPELAHINECYRHPMSEINRRLSDYQRKARK